MPVNTGSRLPPFSGASQGWLLNPSGLTIEAGRMSGYGYNNGNTLALTSQNVWYTLQFSNLVSGPEEEMITAWTPTNGFTINQDGWALIYYWLQATGLDATQTYETAIFVNGVQIDSGLDTCSGVTTYQFGGALWRLASPGMTTSGYYNFTSGDQLILQMRCTTGAGSSATFAFGACAMNPVNYCFILSGYGYVVNAQKVILPSVGSQIQITESGDYITKRMTDANGEGSGTAGVYTRISRADGTRRLYQLNTNTVHLEPYDILDIVTFPLNPAGNTAAPWGAAADMYLKVTSLRSSGFL